MNRVEAVRQWARHFVFNEFYVADDAACPSKFPVTGQYLFKAMEDDGQDTKLFRQAKEAAEAEWKKLYEKRLEDDARKLIALPEEDYADVE